MKKGEAVAWLLFSAGAFISALLLPVHILFTSILPLLGLAPSYAEISASYSNPLIRIYIFILLASAFYHSLHRIRHLLLDFGLGHPRPIAVVVYLVAAILIGLAGYVSTTLPL